MSGPWHSFQMLLTIKVDKEAVLTAEHTPPHTQAITHTLTQSHIRTLTHTPNTDKQLRVNVRACVGVRCPKCLVASLVIHLMNDGYTIVFFHRLHSNPSPDLWWSLGVPTHTVKVLLITAV